MPTPKTDQPKNQLSSGTWRVATELSSVGFMTRLMLGLMTVRGRHSSFAGELYVDAAGQMTGELLIDTESISTGIKKRDTHLRSDDFFAVERFPQMHFDLRELTLSDPPMAALSGTLQIRDTAQVISGPATVTRLDPEHLRIDAELTIDPRAAGLEFKRLPKHATAQISLTLTRTS